MAQARIRTVKPELARHEEMFDLEQETGLPVRFAWTMLFTVCDREGRFEWKPRALKSQVLPLDDLDFSRVLDAWLTRGFIVRYRVRDAWYGYVPTFTKHQTINNRESVSRLPALDQADEAIDLRGQALGRVPDASATGEQRARACTSGTGTGTVVHTHTDQARASEAGGDDPEPPEPPAPVPPAPADPTPTPALAFAAGRRTALLPPAPRNAVFAGKFIVPDFLHAEFQRLAGKTHDELLAWYRDLEARWRDRVIGEGDLKFLRARFEEWVGATGRLPVPAARVQRALGPSHVARDWRDRCPHGGSCGLPMPCAARSAAEHGTTLEAEYDRLMAHEPVAPSAAAGGAR